MSKEEQLSRLLPAASHVQRAMAFWPERSGLASVAPCLPAGCRATFSSTGLQADLYSCLAPANAPRIAITRGPLPSNRGIPSPRRLQRVRCALAIQNGTILYTPRTEKIRSRLIYFPLSLLACAELLRSELNTSNELRCSRRLRAVLAPRANCDRRRYFHVGNSLAHCSMASRFRAGCFVAKTASSRCFELSARGF
jgi:hypothetical protein